MQMRLFGIVLHLRHTTRKRTDRMVLLKEDAQDCSGTGGEGQPANPGSPGKRPLNV